jgi:hypothetical protein
MRVAILGNGPSRNSYLEHKGEYDFVIGCNIPWTEVDMTVILDVDVAQEMIRHYQNGNPNLVTCPIKFGWFAWDWLQSCRKDRHWRHLFTGFIKPKHRESSGHIAAQVAIEKGATEIDLYGIDSWFEETVESHTHSIVKDTNADIKTVPDWRDNWNKFIRANPEVKVEFKR